MVTVNRSSFFGVGVVAGDGAAANGMVGAALRVEDDEGVGMFDVAEVAYTCCVFRSRTMKCV